MVLDKHQQDQAEARSRLGLTRCLEESREVENKHPSRGGSQGYNFAWRMAQLRANEFGEAVSANPRTIRRWKLRPVALRKTGNKQRAGLVGRSLFFLVVFLQAYPDAMADEVAAYVYNNTGEICSRQDISQRMKDIQMSKKTCSREAFQAFTPQNLLKFRQFWTLPPPLGVVGIPRKKLIDVDEFCIELVKTNRKQGHAVTGLRIRKPGHYTRNGALCCLYAIEPGDPNVPAHIDGSIQRPRKWIRIHRNLATDGFVFADFMDHVCSNIEQNPVLGGVDDHRIILCDNLSAHFTPAVYVAVEGRNNLHHRFNIMRRPPYQPKIAPIEYKICDIACELRRRINQGATVQVLEQEVLNIAGNAGIQGNFDSTFAHCGYTVNGAYPPEGYQP